MSPASSGALEVERYIGACLFSSQSRNKGPFSKPFLREHAYTSGYVQHNHHVQQCRTTDGWAGGLPLISFANYQRRNNARLHELHPQEARNPLSKLAVHTKGAPLILSNRYDQHNRKNKTFKTSNQAKDTVIDKSNKYHVQGTDATSVNSDESSGSGTLENVLPRIIKPRKRRKKDRKPLHIIRPVELDECFSTDSGSPDTVNQNPPLILSHYFPFSLEPEGYSDFNQNVNDFLETPKLHHSFDEVQELSKEISDNQTSLCQCRYCDPSGQIWDVDRHCYSPFLTSREENQSNLFFSDLSINSIPKEFNPSSTDYIDRMQNLSLDNAKKDSSSGGCRSGLEVSTEIVTSLNGHRDLEIKFFSLTSEKGHDNYNKRELIA